LSIIRGDLNNQSVRAEEPGLAVRIALAFLAIYLIWGSTFLATRYAVATIPPFFVSGTRFFVAGVLLFAYGQWRKPEVITWKNVAAATAMGALFFLICHGGVSWAAQHVPSGVSALLMSSISLWTAVLELAFPSAARPGRKTMLALLAGFVGIALLVIRPELLAGSHVGSMGATVVLLGAFSWAAGTVLTKRMPLPSSSVLASGMQMMAGGGLLILAGFASGQSNHFVLSAVTERSALAMLFLTFIGSLVGFTCYVWLLGVTSPTRVATYAYVNPIVALLLGWAIGGEHPSALSLVASVIVVGSVATVISNRTTAPAGNSVQPVNLPSINFEKRAFEKGSSAV
jgi:drug/metabolite transporter (DMT)-like permease